MVQIIWAFLYVNIRHLQIVKNTESQNENVFGAASYLLIVLGLSIGPLVLMRSVILLVVLLVVSASVVTVDGD